MHGRCRGGVLVACCTCLQTWRRGIPLPPQWASLCPWGLSHDALSLQCRLEMLCSALWCVVLPGENLCCWFIAPASLMGWACKESTGAMAHSWLAQAEQASQAEVLKTAH